ncbi:MAG: flagellar biosynthesis protein FlhB, partial [Vibrio sp.]
LFVAVAQVLAFVFQLKQYRRKGGHRPKLSPDSMPIPADMRY